MDLTESIKYTTARIFNKIVDLNLYYVRSAIDYNEESDINESFSNFVNELTALIIEITSIVINKENKLIIDKLTLIKTIMESIITMFMELDDTIVNKSKSIIVDIEDIIEKLNPIV
jgi:hypothetical protein